MRIQHNIMAMNAYRNYTNNTSAVAKNLEKLSSGYRINRAGDDAAGLAISEKMRAQITGLSAAQKNVKDGISLVKTAEGAMQEVEDMLNRMVYLAEQSSNGTYQDEVDREAITDEFNQLKSEIDRIADSSNFNGIKLLDGSLSADATSSKGNKVDLSKLGVQLKTNMSSIKDTKTKVETGTFLKAATETGLKNGDQIVVEMKYTDADGKAQTKNYTLEVGNNSAGTAAKGLYLVDGDKKTLLTAGMSTAGTLKATDAQKALKEVFEKDADVKANFKVETGSGTALADAAKGLSFEARDVGPDGAKLESIAVGITKANDKGLTPQPDMVQVAMANTVKGEKDMKSIDLSKAIVYDKNAAKASGYVTNNIEDAIFEINGEKFAFIQKGGEADVGFQAALREAGVTHWVEVAASASASTGPAAGDVKKMVNKISTETGLKVDQGTNTTGTWASASTGTHIVLRAADPVAKQIGKGGLTLQIGDDSETYNQLTVSIRDVHVKALGIDKLDLGTQKGAQEAVSAIKAAINNVSSNRGVLGATQNRLEHTQNNLSVMKENIQDAESSIRDVDVAEEMMSYTKNNILVQSAQAMLAQANQVPQGVLQLLG